MTWLVILAVIAARYDNDGIDIHFLNSRVGGKGLRVSIVHSQRCAKNSLKPFGGV